MKEKIIVLIVISLVVLNASNYNESEKIKSLNKEIEQKDDKIREAYKLGYYSGRQTTYLMFFQSRKSITYEENKRWMRQWKNDSTSFELTHLSK